jgi:hypothetical protein
VTDPNHPVYLALTTADATAGLPAFARIAVLLLLVAASPTPSAALADTATDFHDLIEQQFERYDPEYRAHRMLYGERLNALNETLARAEAQGRDLYCSRQMFLEAKWLQRYTARWDRLEDLIERIEQSLSDHDQRYAAGQLPIDGLWGICHEEEFMRLSATIESLSRLADRGERPRYRIRPRAAFDTGKKLLNGLQNLLVSDIAKSGVNNRAELSSFMTSFAQGAFKPHLYELVLESLDLRGSATVEEIREAFRFFLNGSQDPETGYWGAWYLVDGKIYKSLDLSITYHVIAYTKGRVEHWPEIIETTAAIESEPYPYGWRHDGRYNNHNLYDVARIYKLGWSHMTPAQQQRARRQLESMLAWSLANTFRSDGTIVTDATFSDSLADEYYFAVSLLDVLDYWQPHGRFWSDAPANDDAVALCCRLKQRLNTLDMEGWAAEGAKDKLERGCPRC